MENQQLPTTTSLLLARSNDVRKNGALTIADAALPAAADVVAAINRDLILRKIDTNTVSLPEIVARILMNGDTLERLALGNVLTPESAFMFPSAWQSITNGKIETSVAINRILKPMFALLCEHFNVSFNGNQDTVALTILNQYGGFSFADFAIAFSRVMSGQYWKETQHIMTRGINFEFLAGWLDQYANDREHARERIYQSTKPDNVPVVPGNANPVPEFVKQIRERDEKRRVLELTAADLYGQWESALYDTAIVAQGVRTTQRDETVVENGSIKYKQNGAPVTRRVTVEELCDASEADRIETFPLRVFKPGGSARVLRRLIYGFITFGDSNKTVNVFDDYEKCVRAKYENEHDAVDHIEAEIKIVIATFGGVLRKITGEMFIRAVMRKLHPDANDRQIAEAIERDVAMFRESYFNEYLPACIDRKIPRFKFREYLISQTLPTYIEHGFPNPFYEILK
jgi:hypothetical protein